MPNRSRTAETLEADVVAEAREIAGSLIKDFTPTADVVFLEKNDFVKMLAKYRFGGDEIGAYEDFARKGGNHVGTFDPELNRAICTFTEKRPSYQNAIEHVIHEREGHGYTHTMRARKEFVERVKKAPAGKISEEDDIKFTICANIVQGFNEGFAYWLTVKGTEKIRSDKKRFGKYDQTRIDAWSPLELDERDIIADTESSDISVAYYASNSWLGLKFYSEIEKKFGESAVPLAAKACLDVPLDEIIDEKELQVYLAMAKMGLYETAVDAAISRYAAKKLAELSAVLKPVENEGYNSSLLAKLVEKCEDSFFGVKEQAAA